MFPLFETCFKFHVDNFINQLETLFIILCYLNAHGTIWHCNSTNANKGRIIEKINYNIPTHCIIKWWQFNLYTIQLITLILSTPLQLLTWDYALPNFQWTVLKEHHGSDHFPLVLKLRRNIKYRQIVYFSVRNFLYWG